MQEQICEWKNYPKNMNNQLHSICSYMAMFPPSVPHYFIKRYTVEGDTVMDPFSGRGTTILEACLMKRHAIGNDRNPLAFLLTKAKSQVPQKSRILSRINDLNREYLNSMINIENENENIRMIFSDSTLKQLVFLKNRLKWKRNKVDSFITSMVLGVMHGQSRGYLSISMPNTFSMAPNYVKNYIEKNGLEKPERNVFEILANKLERCYQKNNFGGRTYKQDACRMSRIRNTSVDLIVTSPPYTRVIRYGQFNWIRLWFLGENEKAIDKKLFFSQSLKKYTDFMSKVLREFNRTLIPDGIAVLVIGDVKDRTSDKIFNLAEIVWENCAKPLGFQLVEPIRPDIISDDTKVSKIWGNKKGNATKIDRILVLKKIH